MSIHRNPAIHRENTVFHPFMAIAKWGELRSLSAQHELKREDRMAEGRQSGLQRPVKPSADLAAITGSDPLPRSQVVSKVWDHIRKNNLQNPENKREILADDKLKKIFGKDRCSMFEMNKHLSRHLS
jgi:chromatin remodeling complex protein RSC6